MNQGIIDFQNTQVFSPAAGRYRLGIDLDAINNAINEAKNKGGKVGPAGPRGAAGPVGPQGPPGPSGGGSASYASMAKFGGF